MVAIFTGHGFGTFGATWAQPGAGGGRLGQSRETYAINAATGNLVIQALDESLINKGLAATALRTYNSRGQLSGVGQDGWATGYERSVQLEGALDSVGSVVRLFRGDGEERVFAFDAARGYYLSTAGDGAHDTIAWDGDGWVLGDGSTRRMETYYSETSNPAERLRMDGFIEDGQQWLVRHDAQGRVSEVVSAIGYPNGDAILYSYVGNTTQLAGIATRENGVVRTQVTYGYDSVGRLSWVQTDLTPGNAGDNIWDEANAAANNGRLYRTRYTYVSESASDLRIASVTTGDGAVVSYTYESDGAGGWRVKTVTEGSAADGSARTLSFHYGAGVTDVVDASGRTWTYRYDAEKQLTEVLAPAVNGQRQSTRYAYDAAGNVTRITTSALSVDSGALVDIEEQRFRYDSNGNRIQQRDLLGNIVAWTYNQANQVTSETRYTVADTDGLDADEAGNATSPAGALVTRYVYEHDWSDRLLYVVNAAGEVQEFNYGGNGALWGVLVSERRYLGECYTGTTFTRAALEAWGTDAAAQRRANSSLTTYAYDAKGQLQKRIDYASVNASGTGIPDVAMTITHYSHDAQGLLRQSVVSRGAGRETNGALAGSEVTDYVYDGMGRLLSVLKRDAATAIDNDAQTLQTTYSYLDASNRIQVTQDNGLTRIEARNRAGDLLAVSLAGVVDGATENRISRNYFDEHGRLRASEDAAGGRSYFFYDEAGRLVATVDSTGAVARTEYDAAGRVMRTTRYATRVSTQDWLTVNTAPGGQDPLLQTATVGKRELVFASAQPASLTGQQAWMALTGEDRVAQMSYDAAGRLILASDNAGSEVSYEYDGANRLVRTTQWGDWIYGGGFGFETMSRSIGRPRPTRDSRVTRMFYDDAGRLEATLDAEGYLSRSVYDAGGRVVKTIRYATQTSRNDRANGALATLLQTVTTTTPELAAKDQVTRYFHDVRGRQIGMLDAEGYLSEQIHDEQNNQRASREYAKQLAGLNGAESFSSLRAMALAGAPADAYRESQSSFNALGQLVLTRNHEGTVSRFSYNEAGQLVKTEAAFGTSEVRANGQRYDVFGNLIGELNGDAAAHLQVDMTESALDALYAQSGVRHRYDALGRRIESVDALGNKTWTIHDTVGNRKFVVRGVEDAQGIRNALGEVSEIRLNAFGETIDTLAYDGRIVLAQPGDRTSAVNALGQLVAMEGRSNHTRFSYDTGGRLTSQVDIGGLETSYSYSRYGERQGVYRQSLQGEWLSQAEYRYDKRGLLVATSEYANNAQDRYASIVYDAFGRAVQTIDARGVTRSSAYDRRGRQISVTTAHGGGPDIVTSTRYDAFDRVLSHTDALGNVTQYSHSDSARSTTMTTPEGVILTSLRNAHGQTIETRQPLPDGTVAVSRSTYDNRGLLVQSTDALGNATTHAYDARGLLLRTTDATGRAVAYTYDAAGRSLSRIEDPDGLRLTTRYAYDGQGRALEVTDAAGRLTRMQYDRKGQLIELAVDPEGLNLRTTYTWTELGRELTVTQGAGTAAARTTAYEYDGEGRRLAEIVDPNGLALRTEYSYDQSGNVIMRRGYGGDMRYAYDALGRLRYSIDAMGGIRETSYDRNGRVVAQRAYARALDLSGYGATSLVGMEVADLIAAAGLADDTRDLVGYTVHDRDGRARLSINGKGEMVEAVYDTAGRKVADKAHGQRLVLTPVLRQGLTEGTLLASDVLAHLPATGDVSITRYFHDAMARLIYTVNSVGGMTRMWYDAAGRVEKVRTFAKPANIAGLSTATIGSLDSQIDWAAGYEGESRIYDAVGRVKFQLSADGVLQETRYDGSGQVVVSLRYLKRALPGWDQVDPLLDTQAASNTPSSTGDTVFASDLAAFVAANERHAAAAFNVYDQAGRLRLQLTRIGTSNTHGLDIVSASMLERTYDAAGRVEAIHMHTQQFSSNIVAGLRDRMYQGTAVEADFASRLAITRPTAQVQRMVYDAAGREVYKIDGANGVLATTYTAQGLVSATRRHASALATNVQMTAASIASALSASNRDVVEHAVYDAAGRMKFRVLGDGAVEETRYDGMGRVMATLQYSARLNASQMAVVASGSATESNFSTFVAANENGARVQSQHYDEAGRIRYTTTRTASGNAQVSETAYDGFGRVVASTQYGVEIAYQPGAHATTIESAVNAALSANPAQRALQMRTTKTFHDAEGKPRFVMDASGALSEQRYDAIGRLVETIVYGVRPPASAATDTASLVAWAQAQPGSSLRRTTNAYDLSGNVILRTDNLGQKERFEYDAAGNQVAHIDRSGAMWRYRYDLAGRRIAEISPPVSVSVANPTAASGGSITTTVRSIETRYQYDGARNVIARTDDATGPEPRVTTYVYDARGLQLRTILPNPVTGAPGTDTIEVIYDALGLAVAEKDALGQWQYKVYDNQGRVVYDVDQAMQVTTHEYDALGGEIRTIRHANALNVAGLQQAGWSHGNGLSIAQVQAGLTLSAQDRAIESQYDLLGRKTQVMQEAVAYLRRDGTSGIGRPTMRSAYNTYGEVIRTSVLVEGDPGQVGAVWAETRHFFDALGRETVSIDAEGYVSEQSYNVYGEIDRKTEYARRLSPAVLASLGSDVPPAMPSPGDLTIGHDRTWRYEFDVLGRIGKETFQRTLLAVDGTLQVLAVNVLFGYDAEGRVTSTQDALGTTRTTYDALGRMTSVKRPGRDVVVSDADTLLLQQANHLGTAALYTQRSPYTVLAYDAFGNVSQARQYANGMEGGTDAVNDRISETRYDRRGRVIEERDVSMGITVTRQYDAKDRLIEVRTQLKGGSDPTDTTRQVESNITTTYAYDEVGRQLSTQTLRERFVIASNGTRTTTGTFTDSAEATRYNAFGEIVANDDRVDTAFAAGTPHAQYVYDQAGRVLRSNAQGGVWREYGYDLAGRGIRVTQRSFVTDAAGVQRVVDAVSDSRVDALGRVVFQRLASNSDDVSQRPELQREYDRWGNTIRLVDARGFETQYRYNDQNKLVQEIRPEVKVVNRDGTEVRMRPTITNEYDAHGRVVATKDANGNVDRYTYDHAGRLVSSTDALGKVTRFAYDIFDNERFRQDPRGYLTGKRYDRAGRVTSHGDFLATTSTQRGWTTLETIGVHGAGDRWSTTNGEGNTARYDYDSRRQLLASRSAAGVTKTYDYDLGGRKTRETNGNADRWRFVLGMQDVNGVISVPGPWHTVWVPSTIPHEPGSYQTRPIDPYAGPGVRKDREGELVFLNEQTWDYDYFGRLIDHNDLGGADYDYYYHAETGQLLLMTRDEASTQSVTVGNVQGTSPTPASVVLDNVDGAASTISSISGNLQASHRAHIYYASGLLKEIREGANWTRYAYDANGNRTMEETHTRDGGGNLVHMRTITTYDSNNRVSLVRQYDVASGHEQMTVRYSYDANGNRRRVTTLNSQQHLTFGGIASDIEAYAGQSMPVRHYADAIQRLAPETTFDVTLTLADGSPLPSWLIWDPVARTLQGTPPSAQNIELLFNAVSPDDQMVVTKKFRLNVLPSRPPQLTHVDTPPWTQSLDFATPDWTFQAASAFMDPEGQPLVYSARLRVGAGFAPLPSGTSIDPQTGVITGLPPIGSYQIEVTATDVHQQSVSRILFLDVESMPWGFMMNAGQDANFHLDGILGTRAGSPPTQWRILYPKGAYASWLTLQNQAGAPVLVGTAPSWYLTFHVEISGTFLDGSTASRRVSVQVLSSGGGGDELEINRIAPPASSPVLNVRSDATLAAPTTTNTTVLPIDNIYDDGGDGSYGGGGGGGGASTPTTPGAGYVYLPGQARSFWYDYDAENRVVISHGRLVGGQIMIGVNGQYEKDLSLRFQYDDSGYEYARYFMQNGSEKQQRVDYNLRGQRSRGYSVAAVGGSTYNEQLTYDKAGRLIQRGDVQAGSVSRGERYVYDADGRVLSQTNFIGTANKSKTTYAYHYGMDGILASNAYENYDGTFYQLTYSYEYKAQEGYLETRVNGWGRIDDGHFTPAATTSTYDQWGRRTAVHDGKQRLFAYDMSGGILQRTDTSSYYRTTRYAYVNGQQVAATNSGYIDLTSRMTAYQSGDNGVSSATVVAGDTLRSIAQRMYGNEGLWYVLASANGMEESQSLTPGMTLRVPDVKVNSNDSTTFKPYNPAEIIGSTTPQVDYVPPPPPKKNCGQIVLMIVAVVVAVVVTVFTAGAMAAPASAGLAAIMSTGAAVLAGTAVVGGVAMAAGTMMAIAAVAGVAGALASQLVMMAGDKDYKFDWGAVALGGLTSAFAAGLGNVLSGGAQGAAKAAQLAKEGKTLTTSTVGFFNANAWAKGAATAVGKNLVNYGGNWALNRIDPSRPRDGEKFSWAKMAGQAVSGAITAELGGLLKFDKVKDPTTLQAIGYESRQILTDTAVGFVDSALTHNIASALGEEGRPDYGQMAIDAFGNALAQSAVRGLTAIGTAREEKKARAAQYKQFFKDAQSRFDPNEDIWGNPRQQIEDSPLAPGDHDALDLFASADGEMTVDSHRSWGDRPVPEWDKDSVSLALMWYKNNQLTESEALGLKAFLKENGFKVSVSDDGTSTFTDHDYKAAQLYLIDPELAKSVHDYKKWSPGAYDYTTDDFVSEIQAIVGVKQDGVYGSGTERALSRFVTGMDEGSPASTSNLLDRVLIDTNNAAYKKLTPQQKFIVSIYPHAVAASESTGMSMELMLAQAAQETGWGAKVLKGSNNLFNIKANGGWDGAKKSYYVWEEVNGKKVWMHQNFRVYDSFEESFADRFNFLKGNSRYARAGLFDANVLGNFEMEAMALKKGGYATASDYVSALKGVMNGRTMRGALKYIASHSSQVGATSNGFSSGALNPSVESIANGFDLQSCISVLRGNAHASSTGYCARYVRWGLEAGGINTAGRPGHAKYYGSFLESRGFSPVSNYNVSRPQVGDVAVFQQRYQGHSGHIQMYDGTRWISDFNQNRFLPGSKYANVPFTVYRYTGK